MKMIKVTEVDGRTVWVVPDAVTDIRERIGADVTFIGLVGRGGVSVKEDAADIVAQLEKQP